MTQRNAREDLQKWLLWVLCSGQASSSSKPKVDAMAAQEVQVTWRTRFFFVRHFSQSTVTGAYQVHHIATHPSCGVQFVLQHLGCAELSVEAVLAWASSLKIDDAIRSARFAGGKGDNKGAKGASATWRQRFVIVDGISSFIIKRWIAVNQ